MRGALLLALSLSATPLVAETPAVPLFLPEAESAGLAHSFTGEWEEMVGGGVASFDCSGDAFPDLYLAGGRNPGALYVNAATPGGALTFEKQDSGAEFDHVLGAYPLDIDSDGLVDLALLRQGENLLLRGLGDCRFERANEAWGFNGGDAWSTAFAATWESGGTFPTLAIGNYIDRQQSGFPWGSCTDNWLHRGGARGFAPPLPLTPSYCALSMLFTDWNRSGRPALRVSNDREYYKGGQEQLWDLPPGAPPRLYGPNEGWGVLKVWGMGIASADVTGDGYPDYFLTSMADNKLQVLDPAPAPGVPPRPAYKDIALARGTLAQRPYTGGDPRPSTAWHAQFEDVNNDGRLDLFIAKGNVAKMPDFAEKDPNNLLLQDTEGLFHETGDQAGIASLLAARGAMIEDFNLDGALDLVVVNRNGPVELWRQDPVPPGHWLAVQLAKEAPNVQAIGAWVEVRTPDGVQRREITAGGGHASGRLGWWHFGLGPHGAADLRVIWPGGAEGPWQRLEAGVHYRLRPGAEPEAWRP